MTMATKEKETKFSKTEVPSQLAVPNDLNERKRQDVVAALNPLVADAFALYVKTKNFHWHMSGSYFRDYHLLCDEQATQIFAMVDVLAERARKLGGMTIRSIGQIHRLTHIEDDEETIDPREMIEKLLADNRGFAARLRAAHKVCDDANDVATASFLEVFIDETERRCWFLFELLAQR
nr:DNA protection during starvation protein 1 [uncultured bacterium]